MIFVPIVLMDGGDFIGALAVFFIFGGPIVLGGLSMITKALGQQGGKNVKRLEAQCEAQAAELRNLRERLENVETLVTSQEFQATQRIQRALVDTSLGASRAEQRERA